MEQILTKIPDVIQMISLFLTMITLLATVIVRLTPSKADDEYLSNFTKWWLKMLKIMPTLGINPQTKKLEEALYELREKTNAGI